MWAWDIDRLTFTRRTLAIGERPVPVPLYLPHIPHGLVWDRTRVSAARSLFEQGHGHHYKSAELFPISRDLWNAWDRNIYLRFYFTYWFETNPRSTQWVTRLKQPKRKVDCPSLSLFYGRDIFFLLMWRCVFATSVQCRAVFGWQPTFYATEWVGVALKLSMFMTGV